MNPLQLVFKFVFRLGSVDVSGLWFPLLKKHIYSCENKDYKGIDVKIIMSENDPANLRLFEASYNLESASLHSIPEKN